jgi:hypothetical protein
LLAANLVSELVSKLSLNLTLDLSLFINLNLSLFPIRLLPGGQSLVRTLYGKIVVLAEPDHYI